MPEPVIVATARSPIGRAFKGSLASIRADDLAAQIIRALLAKVPELPLEEIEDLLLGCGLPGGEQGFNIGRVVSVLSGLTNTPGATVNRYCASSLQTIRMASHAIRAGEGHAYIAAGVEGVSRFTKGSSDSLPETENPIFDDARARTFNRQSGSSDWSESAGLPDVYISMGQTAENVAQIERVSRSEQDEFALRSQTMRWLRSATASLIGRSCPSFCRMERLCRQTMVLGQKPRLRVFPSSRRRFVPVGASPPETHAR